MTRAAWLGARLRRRGDPLALVGYAMILVALGYTLVVARPQLAAWRWLGVVVSLLGLLAAQIAKPNTDELVAQRGLGRPYLLVSGGCALAALALAPSYPLALLLLMLSSQALVWLRPREAILTVLPLTPLVVLCHWLAGRPADSLIEQAIQFPIGLLFTAMLSLVLNTYYAQRRHAEGLAAQLAVANAELLAAREREKELAAIEERVRIARDIHDGLGHHLTLLSIQLQAATKILPNDGTRVAALLANCRAATQAALGEVRWSVEMMQRDPLDGRPLDAALATLVGEDDRDAPARATFAATGTPVALPAVATVLLYRSAQEGLTNARKYAAGADVAIRLAYSPDGVRLTVQDDGRGDTPPAEGAPSGGFGLRGLRERAEALGGRLDSGANARGFLLALELPVAGATSGAAGTAS